MKPVSMTATINSATIGASEKRGIKIISEPKEAKSRQVVMWKETQGQYVESKISVFFLP